MILRSTPACSGSMGWVKVISRTYFTLIKPTSNFSICDSPKNFPTSALLNQFCSSLSASTSISLRLNSSALLVPLETFNTENIFICTSFWFKNFLYLVPRHKRPIFMVIIFLFLFFHLKPVCSIILRVSTYFLCMIAIPCPKHAGTPLAGNLQPGHRLPCIFPCSTSLNLIPS